MRPGGLEAAGGFYEAVAPRAGFRPRARRPDRATFAGTNARAPSSRPAHPQAANGLPPPGQGEVLVDADGTVVDLV